MNDKQKCYSTNCHMIQPNAIVHYLEFNLPMKCTAGALSNDWGTLLSTGGGLGQ
jgi:hypothetical protein